MDTSLLKKQAYENKIRINKENLRIKRIADERQIRIIMQYIVRKREYSVRKGETHFKLKKDRFIWNNDMFYAIENNFQEIRLICAKEGLNIEYFNKWFSPCYFLISVK